MQDNIYCLPTTGMIYGTYNSAEERDEEHTRSCRPFLLLSDIGVHKIAIFPTKFAD